MEIRIGDTAGMMNLGIPSIIIKMLRQKFDQQWSVRKTQPNEEEHARILNRMRQATFQIDACLDGPTMGVGTLLNLQEDDVLAFDYPIERPVDVAVNGKLKYRAEIVSTGRKRAFHVHEAFSER